MVSPLETGAGSCSADQEALQRAEQEKVVLPLPCPFWRSTARKWALLAYPLPIVGPELCAALATWLFRKARGR